MNYGIVLKEQSRIVLSNEYWLHTYELQTPENIPIPSIGTCHKDESTCLLISHILSNINTIRAETAIRLNNKIETIRKLIPEARVTKSRSRRSLLPFIGGLSKSLFGTATTDDVNMLARHINALNKRTRDIATVLTQHENHLSSFIVKSNHRMDQLMQGVKDNYIAINYIHAQLEKTTETLEESFQQMLSILALQIKTASHINHELDEFKIGITNLVNGKLSPLLLPQSSLESTLTEIQKILDLKYPGFHVSQTPANIYTSSNFLYVRNGTKLYLTIKIPISHFKEPLTVYKIMSLPIPINSSSAHATHLLSLPDNLLLTNNQQFYASLSDVQLAQCTGKKIKHCLFNLALTPVTTESCILALYINSKSKIHNLCEFRFVHNMVQPKIIELNSNSLILYQTPLLSMQCGNEHKMIKGCDFCIIKMPCQCSITTSNFYLAPRLTSCHNRIRIITKLHPVNLAIMQHFFDNSQTENIFADTTFASPVNLSVPDFKLYRHHMHQIIVDDTSSHLSLSKMANAAKRGATIFQNLAEPLLDGQLSISPAWPDLNAVLIFITMVTTSISIILFSWTFVKTRKLATAILILQQTQGIKSQSSIPSFVYKASNQQETSTVNVLHKLELEWEHAIFAFILLMFGFILYFNFVTTRRSNSPILCLEITNTRKSILIEVSKLPLCPSHCTLNTQSSITDLDIKGTWLSPKLKIQWETFTITNNMSQKLIPLPNNIKLSIFQARHLRSIMKRPFFVFLHIRNYGLLIPVQNTGLIV